MKVFCLMQYLDNEGYEAWELWKIFLKREDAVIFLQNKIDEWNTHFPIGHSARTTVETDTRFKIQECEVE